MYMRRSWQRDRSQGILRSVGQLDRGHERRLVGGSANGENDLNWLVGVRERLGTIFELPTGAADSSTEPFGRGIEPFIGVSTVLWRFKGDLVPQNEGVISLATNTRVGANLSFENARSRASSLGKSGGPLFKKVQGIKR
jgi:hypothetical protein